MLLDPYRTAGHRNKRKIKGKQKTEGARRGRRTPLFLLPRPGLAAARAQRRERAHESARLPLAPRREKGRRIPQPSSPQPPALTHTRLLAAEDEVRVVLGHGEATPAWRCSCGPAEPSRPRRPRVLAGVRAAPDKAPPPRGKTPGDAEINPSP